MSYEKIKRITANNQYEFVYKKKCKSTMLDLKELYNIKNKNYIIISEEQTNGIGRRGNIWHSPKGNIYCSINFNFAIKIHRAIYISFWAVPDISSSSYTISLFF